MSWYPRVFGWWYARSWSCAVRNQVWGWKSKVLKYSQTRRTSLPSCCQVFCTKLPVFCFGIIIFFSTKESFLMLTVSQSFTPFYFWPLFWITDLQMQCKLLKFITDFLRTVPHICPCRLEVFCKSTAKHITGLLMNFWEVQYIHFPSVCGIPKLSLTSL